MVIIMHDYFNNLSDSEKEALIIYKSRMGLFINDIENYNLGKDIYFYYKKIFDNPLNMTYKFYPFKNVDFASFISFTESLENIKETIINIKPYNLKQDKTVFRFASSKENIDDISNGDLISTSESIKEASKFIDTSKKNNSLFQINLKEGSPVLFCPYNFKYDSKNNRLKLESYDNQEEILLKKSDYLFDNTFSADTKLGNMSVNIKIIDAKPLKKNKTL